MDDLRPHQIKELTSACLRGDVDALRRFQDFFGVSIYTYPLKVFRVPKDRAADFFIYVFDNDRIFKRLGSFEGRNEAQLKTYLHFYVLRDLFRDWQRGLKELETVSLDGIGLERDARENEAGFQTPIEERSLSEECSTVLEENHGVVDNLVKRIDIEKRVVWKLLCLAEFDLNADEIRFVCQKSGRDYRETLNLIEEIRQGLTSKDQRTTALHDQLGSIFGWILLYQKELAEIDEDLKSAQEKSSKHTELLHRKAELERKLLWRYRQQKQVREKPGQFRTMTPYKEVARLLNVPLGTVWSLVARTRSALSERLGERGGPKEVAVS